MIITLLKNKKAVSTIEYALLLMIIMGAVFISQRYILRGFAGRWKAVGDTFGQGKQYDPKKTVECAWSQQFNLWYGPDCFDREWNNNYSDANRDCVQTCTGTGNITPCGSGTSGCSRRFFRYDGNCCREVCKTRCTDIVTNNAINACSVINGVSCND